MLISIVIPIFNEEKNLHELHTRTFNTLQQITSDFEILYVDDGSHDNSLQQLIQIHETDKRCKVISLSRNFGHQSAYTAGITYAKGEYTVLMDGDLQDPPELIAELYNKITSNDLDVVIGKRKERKERFVKRTLIKLFHKTFNRISNLHVPPDIGNFSILNRQALNAMMSFQEKSRYMPGLRYFIGFKQDYIEYDRADRTQGSSMSIKQLSRLALDAIFSFSNLPLKFCLYIGMIGTIIFFFVGLFSLISKILGIASPGWSSTLISIYFLGTVQLLFLGVIGEYVYRIYKETQDRSIYFVRRFWE